MSDLIMCMLLLILSGVAAGQGQETASAAFLITGGLYNLAYEIRRNTDRKS